MEDSGRISSTAAADVVLNHQAINPRVSLNLGRLLSRSAHDRASDLQAAHTVSASYPTRIQVRSTNHVAANGDCINVPIGVNSARIRTGPSDKRSSDLHTIKCAAICPYSSGVVPR